MCAAEQFGVLGYAPLGARLVRLDLPATTVTSCRIFHVPSQGVTKEHCPAGFVFLGPFLLFPLECSLLLTLTLRKYVATYPIVGRSERSGLRLQWSIVTHLSMLWMLRMLLTL